MEAHAPFDRGRLAVRRRTPRVPEAFSSGSQGRSIGPGGSVPPYGGIPFRELLLVSDTTLGHPKQLLARASAMYGLAHSCPWLCCPEAAVETLEGPAFEPLDRKGLGAQFLSLEGIAWGIFPFHRLTTAGAPFAAVLRGAKKAPAVAADGF